MNCRRPFDLLLSCILLLLVSCQPNTKADYTQLQATAEQGINAVVEIPAGTNHKIEYIDGRFVNDQEDGADRVIDFLPYPGNYGYIPGTKMEKSKGGDGDALDVLVLAESVPTGTVIQIKPIAALVLKDGGELDTKIIGVPIDSSLQVMKVTSFTQLMTQYNMAQTIIKDWFLNYKGLGEMEFVSWQNERYAEEEIKKWSKH